MARTSKRRRRGRSYAAIAPPVFDGRWSNTATWGGAIPVTGESPTIPAGYTVLWDVASTPNLGHLTIEGTLIADTTMDLGLLAASIEITTTGKFQIGTPATPYTRKASILLSGAIVGTTSTISDATGAPVVTNNDNAGKSRGLINNGQRLWYGNPPASTRSRLADGSAGAAGTTWLDIDDTTGWVVGDEIVVGITSFHPNSVPEKFVIQELTGSGARRMVRIPSPGLLKPRYTRLNYPVDAGGGTISLTQGTFSTMKATALVPTVIDNRAPVIHLTRNIVFGGIDDSAWQSSKFGGHAMTMYPGRMEVRGVQYVRSGQAARLGRYPDHWHMWSYVQADGNHRGDAVGQYIRDCSVDSSSFRMFVAHATTGYEISGNVAFNIDGSALMLEDGSEEDGIIENNWIFKVNTPATIIRQFDQGQGPTGIWWTNAKNTVIGNLVNASEGLGIWGAFATRVFGQSMFAKDSLGVTILPVHRRVTLFDDNTGSSCAEVGFAISDPMNAISGTSSGTRWHPKTNDQASGATALVKLSRTKLFKNQEGGYRNTTTAPDYDNWTMADNLQGSMTGTTDDTKGVVPISHNHLFVGTSLNNDLVNDPIPIVQYSLKTFELRWAFATYHTTLNQFDISVFAYPYQADTALNQISQTGGKIQGGGMALAHDLYLNALEVGFVRFTNIRMSSDTSPGYRMVPNPDFSYSLSIIIDYNNIWGATVGKYVIFDNPFYTTGAANLVDTILPVPGSKKTSTKYYGVQSLNADTNPQSTTQTAAQIITRVDGAGATIGTWATADSRYPVLFINGSGTTPVFGTVVAAETTGTSRVLQAMVIDSGSFAAGNAAGTFLFPGVSNAFPTVSGEVLSMAGATAITNGASQFGPALKFKHFGAQQAGRYIKTFPNEFNPTPTVLVVDRISGELFTSADYFLYAPPWNGTGAHAYLMYGETGDQSRIPSAGQIAANTGRHINTSVASIAAVEADTTGQSYWYDTVNKRVWLRIQGGLTFTSSYATTSNRYLNRNMWLILVPTATTTD